MMEIQHSVQHSIKNKLRADWLISEDNEKTTLNINMPYCNPSAAKQWMWCGHRGIKACIPGVVREEIWWHLDSACWKTTLCANFWSNWRLTAYCNYCLMTCASDFQFNSIEFLSLSHYFEKVSMQYHHLNTYWISYNWFLYFGTGNCCPKLRL